MQVIHFVSFRSFSDFRLRLNTSPGYPWLTTGIPVGKPTGVETRGSELLVITGLHGSGFLLWVLQVLATSTCETKVFYFIIIYYITRFDVLSSVDHRVGDFAVLQARSRKLPFLGDML